MQPIQNALLLLSFVLAAADNTTSTTTVDGSETPAPVDDPLSGVHIEWCQTDLDCRTHGDLGSRCDAERKRCVCSAGYEHTRSGNVTEYACRAANSTRTNATQRYMIVLEYAAADCAKLQSVGLGAVVAGLTHMLGFPMTSYGMACGSVHLAAEFQIETQHLPRLADLPTLAYLALGDLGFGGVRARVYAASADGTPCAVPNALRTVAIQTARGKVCTATACNIGFAKSFYSSAGRTQCMHASGAKAECLHRVDCAAGKSCINRMCTATARLDDDDTVPRWLWVEFGVVIAFLVLSAAFLAWLKGTDTAAASPAHDKEWSE